MFRWLSSCWTATARGDKYRVRHWAKEAVACDDFAHLIFQRSWNSFHEMQIPLLPRRALHTSWVKESHCKNTQSTEEDSKKGIEGKINYETENQKKLAKVSPFLSMITLNVNELNFPIKRHKVAEWIRKQDPTICHLQEIHFILRTHRLKVKEWKNTIACKY